MIALAATTLFSACQKDNEHLVDLTAVIADQPVSNAKVYIDGIYGCWQHGDAVKIKSGSNGTESYSLTVAGSGEAATRATIPGVTEGAPYTAGYPGGNATITGNGTLTIDVPASQSYAEAAIYSGAETVKQRIVCPMAAYSPDGSDLKFYNVAAMLAVTVTNSESSSLTLYAVEVESDKSPLSGTASVSVDANGAAITGTSGTSQSVTLTFGTTVTLAGSESRTVYIPVLPIGDSEGEKSTLTVHVKATANADGSGSKYTFHDESSSSISIESNQIGNVPVTLNTSNPETEVNDYFWGQGTEDCPYLITNYADLVQLRSLVNDGNNDYNANTVYYLQIVDINIYTGSGNESNNWCNSTSPSIGNTSTKSFKANYDGGNHVISKLNTIDNGLTTSIGLFGYANGATIQNLTVSGYIKNSAQKNCGGLLGESTGSSVSIINCTSNVIVTNANSTSTNLYAGYGTGGIVGKATSACIITNCVNNSAIKDSLNMYYGSLGGIVGININSGTTISECNNTAALTTQNNGSGYGWLGGICGRTLNANIEISGCHNSGILQGNYNSYSNDTYIGGILGECLVNTTGATYTATITSCVNESTGSLSSPHTSRAYIGGIIGGTLGQNSTYHANAAITSCSNYGTIVTYTDGGNSSWTTRIGGIMGYSSNYGETTIDGCTNYAALTGTKNYTATGGILGTAGKTTTDITIKNCINESTGTIDATSSAGGILGTALATCKLESNTNKGAITGTSYIGGIAGKCSSGITIQDCNNQNSIKGNTYVGGILGAGGSLIKISGCSNSSSIEYNTSGNGTLMGGIVGQIDGSFNGSYIDHCFNSGSVTSGKTTGEIAIGGIIGKFYNSAAATATIKNCGNTGDVVGAKAGTTSVGGLVGLKYYSSSSVSTLYVYNSYVNCVVTGGQYSGGIIGKDGYSSNKTVLENCYFAGTLNTGASTYCCDIGTATTSTAGNFTATYCYVKIGCYTGTGTEHFMCRSSNYINDPPTNCAYFDNSTGTLYADNEGASTTSVSISKTVDESSVTTTYDNLGNALRAWQDANSSYTTWNTGNVPTLN